MTLSRIKALRRSETAGLLRSARAQSGYGARGVPCASFMRRSPAIPRAEPELTALKGTAAPVSISRIPGTGDLLAIWNHNPGASKRNPLTAAISKDEGESWQQFRNLEDAANDAWAYPAVTWVEDRALITYFNYSGGLSLQLRILPASWFYEE